MSLYFPYHTKEVFLLNLEKIHEIAFRTMGKRKSHLNRERGFIYYHCERVAKISIHLRKELFPDDSSLDDRIYVGALFHDVAKGIEPHHQTGSALIRTLLQEECTGEELDDIADIIRYHNTRHQEDLPFHIKIVQDADVMDHFGSLEIWLKFVYSGHMNENVFDAIRLWESEEYKKYLENSRHSLNYERSREIFDRKVEFAAQFENRFR